MRKLPIYRFVALTLFMVSCGSQNSADVDYSAGANSEKELAEALVKAIKNKDLDAYQQLIPNASMEQANSVDKMENAIADMKEKGQTEYLDKMEQSLQELKDQAGEKFKALEEKVRKNANEKFARLKGSAQKYMDFDNLDMSNITIKDAPAIGGKSAKFVQMPVKSTEDGSTMYTASFKIQQAENGKWYYMQEYSMGK